MDPNAILFVETDVCDSSAWSLKWGTLILFSGGFVFNYNRPRKDAPGRMQDVMKIGDVTEVSIEKMDWLVSKIFWVGRKMVKVKTHESEHVYYLRNTENFFAALRFIKQDLPLTDRNK